MGIKHGGMVEVNKRNGGMDKGEALTRQGAQLCKKWCIERLV